MIPEWSLIGPCGWLTLPLVSDAMDSAIQHLEGIVPGGLLALCKLRIAWGSDYTTHLAEEGLRSLNAAVREICMLADIFFVDL